MKNIFSHILIEERLYGGSAHYLACTVPYINEFLSEQAVFFTFTVFAFFIKLSETHGTSDMAPSKSR